jgi:hypothetical protein
MSRLAVLSLFLMLALFPLEGSAQTYKYVDKDGVVHFTNTPSDPAYKPYMATEREKEEALKPSI